MYYLLDTSHKKYFETEKVFVCYSFFQFDPLFVLLDALMNVNSDTKWI